MKTNRCFGCSPEFGIIGCLVDKAQTVIFQLAVCWAVIDPANAAICTRLTVPIWDSGDLAARVQIDYGAGSAVADWNAIKDQFAGNLTAFYTQTGLANNECAFVTMGGSRYWNGTITRQYFIKRSDSRTPGGDIHDSADTLFLQSYVNLQLPVVATVPYQLGMVRSGTDDIPTLLTAEFGLGTVLAEWHTLTNDFATNFPAFYAQTGLAESSSAIVTRRGERYFGFFSTPQAYFLTRSDAGLHGVGYYYHTDSLYLRYAENINLPTVVRSTLRLSTPMADSADIPAQLESLYGAGTVLVDWKDIKDQGSTQLDGFYANTGLLSGHSAFVTYNGARTVSYNGQNMHYYVTRSDIGLPDGFIVDSIGTLHLQRWNNVTFPAVGRVIPPPAPTSVTASDNLYNDRVLVAWTGGGHTQSYNVWRGYLNDANRAVMVGDAITGTSFADYAGAGGVMYYWVKACNAAGTSAFSTADTGSITYTINLAPANQSLSNIAQQYDITVTSNGQWSATDDQNWITLSKASGFKNQIVTVTVTANTGSVVTRTGTITIGGQSHLVTQEGVVWPSPAAFRLTEPVADSTDIAAHVTSTFGGSAAVADWNNLLEQAGPNLPVFYTQTGLGNQAVALVTKDGNRRTDQYHYFVKHSSTPPPGRRDGPGLDRDALS